MPKVDALDDEDEELLIYCPQCHAEISSLAVSCPHCRHYIVLTDRCEVVGRKPFARTIRWIITAIIILTAVMVLLTLVVLGSR